MTFTSKETASAADRGVWQRLSGAAWLALATHFAAGVSTLFILQPGLETNDDLASRLRYVAEQKALWIAGWLVWNGAALSILYFFASLSTALRRHDSAASFWPRLALYLTVAAIAPDLTAEVVEMGVLPRLAAQGDTSTFLPLHRAAVLATGYVANGLYSIATLLLACSARTLYPRWMTIAALAGAAGGFLLSAMALADSANGMVAAHVLLIPGLLVWFLGIALVAPRHAG